jgi:hypothetical protein
MAYLLFHHYFPYLEHFRQELLFERQLEINRLYGQSQFDRTIFAFGLQISGEIGRNCFCHHVEALKQAKQRNEIVIDLEKVRQTKEKMIMSLSTVGEDAYYHKDYYDGVKRLIIKKLFDVREPYMTKEYAAKNNIYF